MPTPDAILANASIAMRLPDIRVTPVRTDIVIGSVFVAFGWIYPHFLDGVPAFHYLYESPFGLIPGLAQPCACEGFRRTLGDFPPPDHENALNPAGFRSHSAGMRGARSGGMKIITTLAALGIAFGIVPPAQAQPSFDPGTSTAAFIDATREYAAMHRRLENVVGRIEINSSADEINRSMAALAAAIRAERRDARQGDFFTPALGRELRARINDALLDHDFTAEDVRASARVDAIDPRPFRPEVNGPFFWVLAAAMFPCVIESLPPLPPELQYRIVGNDLLLIDVHASLIVDFLPQVLIERTTSSGDRGKSRDF